ncbi:MAG: cation:proton antiporter subunit C [Longimicrobiales bacterium]|nr:cation:proton antiporter subunit C [Longimicrobiales bacterium]
MNILGHYNYWIFIFLMMVGFYTIIARGNLVKKVVGLSIFQTSVFIFYISLGKIIGGTAPILVGGYGGEGGHGEGGYEEAAEGAAAAEVDPETVVGAAETTVETAAEAAGEMAQAAGAAAEWGTSTAMDGVVYSNPLPHVLILTAIVVGIATTALALALVVRIRETYGTIEEDEIHEMDLELEASTT